MNVMTMRLCFVSLFFCSLQCLAQSDFAVIRERVREDLSASSKNAALEAAVGKLISTQLSNGSWAGVNYADRSATKWAPATHLDNVKTLAIAFTKKGQSLFGQPTVFNAIVTGLRYWYATDPKSGNWWHNEIATPQALGEILILLKDAPTPLPAPLQDALVKRMQRGNPYEKTGANKLDIAIHYLYRACITENRPLMDSAVEEAFQPVSITTEEGLQPDFSYLQHGPQLQIASYGQVFLEGEYKIAWLVRGTPYALKKQKQELLSRYLVQSFLPAIRGRYIDFNTEGRGIARPDILDKKKLAAKDGLLQKAAALDAAHSTAINNARLRLQEQQPPAYGIMPRHTHFWRADYTQHIRPAYLFNVRTVSSRTKRTETGNRENLLGKFLPDGSTNIQRSGSEYFNIMPVWEWDKIPGVTSRDFAKDPEMTVQWGEQGSTSFAGGVSDSVYGASVYQLNYDSVKANKAWFFFDKEVVCLGSGIQATAPERVVTTLNQCWLKGPVYVKSNGNSKEMKEADFEGSPEGMWHDSIGYFFPTKQVLSLRTGVQSGRWSDINAKTSEKVLSGGVFKAWLSHGTAPTNASYEYIVVPGIAADDLKKETVQNLEILANTPALQAVLHKGLQMVQAIFYQPGKLMANGYALTVDKPCAVLLKLDGGNLNIHLSDPAQKQDSILLLVENERTASVKTLRCALPQGSAAGASVAASIALP